MKELVPVVHFDHIKYTCDGATTVAEIASALRSYASFFEDLAMKDATLTQPVDGGHVNYVIPGHAVEVEKNPEAATAEGPHSAGCEDGEECPECFRQSAEDEFDDNCAEASFGPCPMCEEERGT
jgi:hypothetical protein